MRQALAIASKNLKHYLRNVGTLSIMFILPIVFMVIFAIVFGSTGGDSVFKVGYVKNDDAVFAEYRTKLNDVKNSEDKSRFEMIQFDSLDQAKDELKSRKISAVLDWQGVEKQAVYVDRMSILGNSAAGILITFTNQFFGVAPGSVVVEGVTPDETNLSGFDYLVPGLIVYGILSFLPQVTFNLTEESNKQKTFRYFTAKVKGWQIIVGYFLSQSLLAVIQTGILLTTAILLGYETQAQPLLVLLVALPTNLFTVGVGLLLGGIFKQMEVAANVGTMVSVILGFVSGAFVQFPEITLWRGITLSSLIPTSYASETFRDVLQFNRGLGDIIGNILILTVTGVALLLVGSAVYGRVHLSRLE